MGRFGTRGTRKGTDCDRAFPATSAGVEFASPVSYPVGTLPARIVIADFNGDGKLDIAVANSGSANVSILLGNGDGTFRQAHAYSVGGGMTSVAAGDFNADGRTDLVVAATYDRFQPRPSPKRARLMPPTPPSHVKAAFDTVISASPA